MNILNKLMIVAVIACAMASCGDDNSSSSYPSDVCYDFATLASNSDGSTFTLRKSNDSDLITYYSSNTFATSTGISEGDRLIIMYYPVNGTAYTTGQITLYGYRALDNTEQDLVLTDSEGVNVRKSNDISVISLARTGQYINLQANFACQSSQKPNSLILVADSTKLDIDYPELTILYEAQQDGFNYYGGYASFDIESVWNLSTCKGVVINYMTGDGEASTTFNKTLPLSSN